MLIPIRCFTCGKLIAHKWEDYDSRTKAGEDTAEVLTDLGFSKYCCRRMFIGHINVIDEVIRYDA